MTREFNTGDRVAILNHAGKFIVEGYATLIRKSHPSEGLLGRWLVRFDDGEEGMRFVDPAAQDDPEGFVAELNRPV